MKMISRHKILNSKTHLSTQGINTTTHWKIVTSKHFIKMKDEWTRINKEPEIIENKK